LIIVSSGFDSAKGDPLGGIALSPLAYAWMTHGLSKICPKVAVILEGGYDLDALAISSLAVIMTLQISG
jgi:acetoin utilization deacetylase AcuC-like enzyme